MKSFSKNTGLIVLAILIVIAVFAVFVYRQNTQNNQKPVSQVINLNTGADISSATNADGTMGPATWYGNFSNTLPSSELGTLTFAVTDPAQGGRGHNGGPLLYGATVGGGRPSTLPSPAQGQGQGKSQSNATESSRQKPHGPQTVTSLVLTVTKVEVHMAYLGTPGSQNPNPTGATPSAVPSPKNGQPVDHWETLNITTPVSVDLVKLANGGTSVLGLTKLAQGRYTEVRLYVSSATATLADGTNVTLTILGKDNIVRIVQPFTIVAGQNTSLTMDFDAQHSVIATGNGTYILKPVVARLVEGK